MARVERLLLAFERDGGGFEYRWERPHHAWASTFSRLRHEAPDAAALAEELGGDDVDGAAWTADGVDAPTGIVRTTHPVRATPAQALAELAELDDTFFPPDGFLEEECAVDDWANPWENPCAVLQESLDEYAVKAADNAAKVSAEVAATSSRPRRVAWSGSI